jgi:phenylacetate-CoA ligase
MALTDPAAYAASFDAQIAQVLPPAAGRIGAFGDRLAAAGVETADLVGVAALDRIPVQSKDELMDLQRRLPPFGGLLDPGTRPRRVFQSPGPIYEPEPEGDDPWRWAPALRAAGFGPDDVVLNAFAYHLSPAGAMFEEAARSIGCTVVPGGVGNKDLQLQACLDLGISGFVGLPSYLKALVEEAEQGGLTLAIRKAFVTAEPLPPSLRRWLQRRVATVRQGYGTAEAGNLGFECDRTEGLHVPEDALIQVCDLSTGTSLWDGREGEIVATVLTAAYPLVRLGTGDLSRYLTDPCDCDVATPRIAGWLGRVGDAVKVRGMFLHPRQAESLLARVSQAAGFRFLVDRVSHRDELRVEVVARPGADEQALVQEVRERVRSGLRFDAEVELVPSLDPDSPRVVDRRTWE